MTATGPATAVIGASGYLGRHASLLLDRMGYRNAVYGLSGAGSGDLVELDVTRRDSFEQLDPGLSRIFFFAGVTGTARGFDAYERFVQVNEIGLLNLLRWMVDSECRARVVFPSSRLVYRGQAGVFLREEAPKEARTLYAVNKLAAESILRVYANTFGIDYTVFRIGVPYGELLGQGYPYGTMRFLLDHAAKGEDLTLYGEGEVRRTFAHVEDVCGKIIAASALPETSGEILNVGGQALSLRQAAAAVAERFGVGLRFVPWPDMAARLESGDTVFDSGRLDALLPEPYRHDFFTWIRSLA